MQNTIRVGDIINKANAVLVSEIYNATYNSHENADGWGTPESYDEFRQRLNDTVGVRGSMRMVLTEKTIGLDLTCYKDEDPTRYAVMGFDWGEIKEMTFTNESGKDLSIEAQAATIYFEMTYHGWPEDTLEKIMEIRDMVEALDRGEATTSDFLPREEYLEILEIMTGVTKEMLEKVRSIHETNPEEAAKQLATLSGQPLVDTIEIVKTYFSYSPE